MPWTVLNWEETRSNKCSRGSVVQFRLKTNKSKNGNLGMNELIRQRMRTARDSEGKCVGTELLSLKIDRPWRRVNGGGRTPGLGRWGGSEIRKKRHTQKWETGELYHLSKVVRIKLHMSWEMWVKSIHVRIVGGEEVPAHGPVWPQSGGIPGWHLPLTSQKWFSVFAPGF